MSALGPQADLAVVIFDVSFTLKSDISRHDPHDSFVPILLQKSVEVVCDP